MTEMPAVDRAAWERQRQAKLLLEMLARVSADYSLIDGPSRNAIVRRASRLLLQVFEPSNRKAFARELLEAAGAVSLSPFVVTLGRRKESGFPAAHVKKAKVRSRIARDGIIAREVLRVYKVSKSLDEATATVAEMGSVSGVKTGGQESVRKAWLRFRERVLLGAKIDPSSGWMSAYGLELSEEDLTLADFPPVDGQKIKKVRKSGG